MTGSAASESAPAPTEVERSLVATPAAPQLPPKAVFDSTEHDFGVMDPFKRRTHAFTVRNEGEGPLRLKVAGSSCKCTVGKLESDTIEPGEEGELVLEWQTKRQASEFVHSATILTNDPDMKRLRLVIRGTIRIHLGADPPELVFSDIRPGHGASAKTLLSSEVWPEFEIRHIESTMPGLTWTLNPASQELLDALGSLAGHELEVNLPKDLPSGTFGHTIKLTVGPPDKPEESKDYEISVEGHVLRRLSIYGEGIDSTGTIRLGNLPPGQGGRKTFLVKIYDDHPDLLLKRIETDPAFLVVSLQPQRVEEGKPGLYRLTVAVPADAPVGARLNEQRGEIRINSGHPRISQTRLFVEFVVTAPARRKTSGQ
jgi:hypothetical protein